MKILVIGDLVGEGGLSILKTELPKLIKEQKIDFVIVNGENVAGGMGITKKHFDEIIKAGCNVVTMGNHTWGKKDIFTFIDDERLVRPANYPKGVVGKGFRIFTCKNKKIAVINLLGRTDMNIQTENPFLEAEKIINDIKDYIEIIIVDFHAEATAEKIAMGYFLDGKVTAIFGTHTHVQTADERILPNGTGYITDIGMTGPINSVIGMEITTLPEKYKLADGKNFLNGCIFDINDETSRIKEIKRINIQ